MAENKMQPHDGDVTAFIESVADEKQRADAHMIAAMMAQLSGEPPKMWGPSIIGFGHYHYKYDSGREGDSLRIGFSPRKGQTVLYLPGSISGQTNLLARLGKKGCLYIKRLADVDAGVLEALVRASIDYMDEAYPARA